ncbi:MAG TPA: cytochrome c [Thermoanaerobaculia bacterium]|jgi:hypothetical protein|nr:cytochrome c [Thermoanaerobaculia bacterium]
MKLALALLLALTPAQERGQHIYVHGESKSGRAITATVGDGGTPFSAAIVPCVNCHGEDGRGRIEANVRPADITPEALGRKAIVNTRTRPAYSRSHLKRAIGMGFDSARNPLSSAMPRYALTQDDASDLLDFLAILGSLSQPGVSEDAIRIGVIGDDSLRASDQRIYGRRIELVHDDDADVFARICMTPCANSAIPTIDVQSLTASIEQQREALREYARGIGVEVAIATDCSFEGESLFMTEEVAERCGVPPDRLVIVAFARPTSDEMLSIVIDLLERLGRDATREDFNTAVAKRINKRRSWLTTTSRPPSRPFSLRRKGARSRENVLNPYSSFPFSFCSEQVTDRHRTLA